MSALSNVRDTPIRPVAGREAILAATIKVYKGALVVRDTATGYDKPGVTGTGLVARGIADMSEPFVDTTGLAAGSRRIQLITGVALLANDGSITAANRGAPCFIVDDQTVALTDGGGTRSVAGAIEDVDSRGVWARIESVDGTALAAEITARQALPATAADTVVGIPVVLTIAVADGATGNVDVVVPNKTEILSVTFNKNTAAGGASDTIQAANGATTNYITNALDINVAANIVVRNSTLLSANAVLTAGATLRVIRTKASAANVGGTVVVTGVRRA
jgi:hypothetical protein